MMELEARERQADGAGTLLSGPRIQILPGTAFSTVGGQVEENGQHREIWISGYLSADGKSVAAVLIATAIWTDPSDGREYVYAQSTPSREIPFVSLSQATVVVSSLEAGAALERPVDLTVRLAPPR